MLKKHTKTTISFLLLLLFSFTIFVPSVSAATTNIQYLKVYLQNSQIIAKKGDTSEVVKEIKIMLKTLKQLYYYGSPSNYYTTATMYAVYYFQKENGLTQTGVVDLVTYSTMKAKYQEKIGQVPVPTPVPTPTPAPAPEPAPVSTPTPGLTAEEQQMIDLVNQERAKAGAAPLKVDMRLVESARIKSKDMIDNNYFSHTSPTLGQFYEIIRQKTGSAYAYLGENLAGAPTVQIAHNALMNSEGHRKNILNPNYTHIGIGIVKGGPYGIMFTQHFGGTYN